MCRIFLTQLLIDQKNNNITQIFWIKVNAFKKLQIKSILLASKFLQNIWKVSSEGKHLQQY